MSGPSQANWQHDSQDDSSPNVRTRRIEGRDVIDLFLDAAPASTRQDVRTQFTSMATRARQALAAQGLGSENIVFGRLHFAKEPPWPWRDLLGEAWETATPLPITGLIQPPADSFAFCTMQLHAIRVPRPCGVWHGNSAEPSASTVLRAGARHLRLMSITPRPELLRQSSMADFAYDMFAQAGHALTARGMDFGDVVRTWIHARDIDRNYDSINQARNRYFAEQQVARLPASTCVEGHLAGSPAQVAMDVYAVRGSTEVLVHGLAPGAMGEATEYGSAFARGIEIDEPRLRTLWVSGTASIDEQGKVVAAGNLAGQIDRMLANLSAVLAGGGAGLSETMCATVYLKRASHLPVFQAAAREAGWPMDAPISVVVADICRPDWLCEVELVAARPRP